MLRIWQGVDVQAQWDFLTNARYAGIDFQLPSINGI